MTAPSPTHAEPSRIARLGLIADHPGLDFANTASGRGGDHHHDHLHSVDDLVLWSRRAGLLNPVQAVSIDVDRRAEARIVARAVKLREAIHAIAAAFAAGAPPPQPAISILGRTYRRALAEAELVTGGDGLAWRWSAAEAWQVLGPIAHSAIVLFGAAGRERIKQCPGRDCGWVFLDRTKNGSRRWCEMKVCGNRAKLRRYHHRHRGTDG
jgi:predicted RNA-binding Zn ribbon-like protein